MAKEQHHPRGKDLQRVELPIEASASLDLADVTRQSMAYADSAIAWYTTQRHRKRRGMGLLRYSAIVLVGLAGMFPVVVAMLPEDVRPSTLWATLLIGIAALLLAIDRFGDLSRGWMRYMIYTLKLTHLANAFLFDWIITRRGWTQANAADPAQAREWLGKCRAFVEGVDLLVREETNEWVTAFGSNLDKMDSEMEHARALRAKLDLSRLEAVEAGPERTGGLNVTVTNPDKLTDGWCVRIGEMELGGNRTGRIGASGIGPGPVTVALHGGVGTPSLTSRVVEVPPGKIVDIQLEAPPAG